MKRVFLTVFLMFVIVCAGGSSLIVFSQESNTSQTTYDFRKTRWGMSKKEVKASEGRKSYYEEDKFLAYIVTLLNKKFLCFYLFLEDKLFEAGYRLFEEHSNENDYIDDYKRLKEILTEKYGKPTADSVNWKSDYYKDLYKKELQEWGYAVSVGHLKYKAKWDTPTTKIILDLEGEKGKINLTVWYISKELEDWASKIMEEGDKSEF